MNLKSSLLSAAAVGLSSGTALAGSTAAKTDSMLDMHAPKNGVQCFGTNTCKGTATCAVTAEQIRVANQVFNNKFLKAKPHSCGGGNTCGVSTGNLDWVQKPNAQDCFKAGGFVFEKTRDPKTKKPILVIKKS